MRKLPQPASRDQTSNETRPWGFFFTLWRWKILNIYTQRTFYYFPQTPIKQFLNKIKTFPLCVLRKEKKQGDKLRLTIVVIDGIDGAVISAAQKTRPPEYPEHVRAGRQRALRASGTWKAPESALRRKYALAPGADTLSLVQVADIHPQHPYELKIPAGGRISERGLNIARLFTR